LFIRAKTIKGQKYAYLVKNVWKNGKVKQITKKYLGKIFDLSSDFDEEIYNNFFIDFSKDINIIFKDLISRELSSFSFVFDGKNGFHHPSGLVVKLTKRSKIFSSNKNIVLFFNKRYVYPKLFDLLLNYYEPESETDKKGERLAFRLRDAGIQLNSEEFILLYKKIYLSDSKDNFIRKSDFDY